MLDVMNNSASSWDDWKQEHTNPVTGQFDPSYQSGPKEGENPINDWLGSIIKGASSGLSSIWDFLVNTPSKVQDWAKDKLGLSNIASSLNSANTQGKIAYTESGIPYDATNIDSQINAKMTELAYKRDDESYDRLIAALKRNGINPVLALSNSASPMSSDSGYRSNYSLTDKDQVNSALKVGMIIALLMKVLK